MDLNEYYKSWMEGYFWVDGYPESECVRRGEEKWEEEQEEIKSFNQKQIDNDISNQPTTIPWKCPKCGGAVYLRNGL